MIVPKGTVAQRGGGTSGAVPLSGERDLYAVSKYRELWQPNKVHHALRRSKSLDVNVASTRYVIPGRHPERKPTVRLG